ncbi:unnamed protein product [Danaus chrysippus]|uniref:(African queen) hypothetical protein n=1 Tax=Danaus chrysippus TaxID=151541 RepID=A0A8J2QEL1_9NEOP|nr:unnamed protein product [Danaus chrysippus]
MSTLSLTYRSSPGVFWKSQITSLSCIEILKYPGVTVSSVKTDVPALPESTQTQVLAERPYGPLNPITLSPLKRQGTELFDGYSPVLDVLYEDAVKNLEDYDEKSTEIFSIEIERLDRLLMQNEAVFKPREELNNNPAEEQSNPKVTHTQNRLFHLKKPRFNQPGNELFKSTVDVLNNVQKQLGAPTEVYCGDKNTKAFTDFWLQKWTLINKYGNAACNL